MDKTVALEDLLDAKENRRATQQRLKKTFGATLVCLTVNFVGQIKKNKTAEFIFKNGVREINDAFCGKIKYSLINEFFTGYEGFFVVENSATQAKTISCAIEDKTAIGRLFDIDVFDSDGNQISRTQIGLNQRKCLLCDRTAAECYVERRHTTAQLAQKINEIVGEYDRQGDSPDSEN